MEGNHPYIEVEGRIQITYLVTVVEIDIDKLANFRHLPLPRQARGQDSCVSDAGMGAAEFWKLVMIGSKHEWVGGSLVLGPNMITQGLK